MATLKRLNKETGTYEIIPVGGGMPEAPEDGKQYVRQDGEWASLSIEPSSPFANQEYADIVVNAINNNSISSDDYNKLSAWAVPVNDIYPYAETLFQGAVVRMNIATADDGIYAYMHMTRTLTNSPLVTLFMLLEIKEDLTLTIKEQSGIVLDTSGDGTKFLANDGQYKEIESSEPFVNAEYGKILKEANESQSITQDNYNLILNAITASSNGALFCEYEHLYGRLYFTALPTDSGDILVYVNVQMAHVPEPSFMSGAMTISSNLTVSSNGSSSITLNTSGDGSKFLTDNGQYVEIDTSNLATKNELEGKQNTISDLDTIRSNAEKGKQALESLPTNLSQLTSDETHRTVTDSEKSTWNSKSDFSGSFSDLTNIPATITNLRSYTTATTVASLDVNYESIYVNLTASASLSASATGSTYNGRTITAYVYTDAAMYITIPTTGDYVSMCGNLFNASAGCWVEFNLTCIDGKWHIAKLEQEESISTNPT